LIQNQISFLYGSVQGSLLCHIFNHPMLLSLVIYGCMHMYVYLSLIRLHPLTLFYKSFQICFLRLALGNIKIKPSATCTKDFFEENEPKLTEFEGQKLWNCRI
jgi:hypothetical protein